MAGQHQVRTPIIQKIFQTVIVVCRPSLSRAQRGGAEVELPRGTVESGAVLLADAHLVPEHRLLPILLVPPLPVPVQCLLHGGAIGLLGAIAGPFKPKSSLAQNTLN